MNKQLKQFYDNEGTREAVREFLIQTLKELAVERVFAKGTVSGIYEGKKAIEVGFDKLEEMFGIIKEQKVPNSR